MAIQRYAGDFFTGLSTDTKPTGVGGPTAGARWLETDTNTLFRYNGTAWVVALDIDGLANVDITTATNLDFLKYNNVSGNWENGQLVLADISDFTDLELNDNNDVTITAPALDQVLSYNGSGQWVNVDLTSIISDIEELDDLTDVTVTTPATDQILYYNGSQWVNAIIGTGGGQATGVAADIRALFSGGTGITYNSSTGVITNDVTDINDLGDVVITTPADDQVLVYSGGDWVNVNLSTIINEVADLDDLTDVVIGTPAAGEVLYFNGTNWVDQALDTADVAEDPSNLYFTDARAVSAIQADPSWNASDWDTAFSWGDHAVQGYLDGTSVIDDLADVDTTTVAPSNGQILEWDGSNWVPANNDGGLTTVATDATITGDGTGGDPLSVNINDSAAATTDELYSGDYIDANFQRTSEKNQANGYVGLNSNTKIDRTYLPELAITDVFVVADITARDALVIGTAQGEVQEGDVAVVTDASADPEVPSGSASYIYDGSGWVLMGTPDIVAAGANTQVQYNDNGDFGASVKFTFDDSGNELFLQSNFLMKEQAVPATPSNVDEAVYFVESDANDTFVKVKMENGFDVIIASYRHTI